MATHFSSVNQEVHNYMTQDVPNSLKSNSSAQAIKTRNRSHFLRPILSTPHVPDPHRRPVHRGDHKVVELPRILDPTHRPQHTLPQRTGHVAPGDVRVLTDDRVPDRRTTGVPAAT